MIAIFLMIVGGGMIAVSIIGILAFIFQPLYEDFQVVIKRKDDYAHYATPSGRAYLSRRTGRYWKSVIFMLIIGCILFFTGFYMKFGERGFGMLLGIEDKKTAAAYENINSEIASKINDNGDYVSENGITYILLTVKGREVFYRDRLVGNTDDFREFIKNIDIGTPIYLLDGYASSATYSEIRNILDESGFEYEMD